MSITYHDIRLARQDAQSQIDIADEAVKGAAALCAGRLRVSRMSNTDVLVKLKAELRDFNSVTRCWKDKA